MFGLGAGEILIILFIALIAIGPEKLPGVAKNLAKTVGEFQRAMRGVSDSIREPMDQIKQQIQDQANAQPVSEFEDDPEHDQNIPHDEVPDPWGPKEDTAASDAEGEKLEQKIAGDLGIKRKDDSKQNS